MSQSGTAPTFSWLPGISPDGWPIFVTCGVRGFAFGFLSVCLGLLLAADGLGVATIGIIFAAALAGGAGMTVAFTSIADRVGRRRCLMAASALMAAAGAVYALSASPIVLGIAALFGTISPSGKDVGPFLSIEQAILPQTTSDENRTSVFAAYNVVGSFAGALGALSVGVPSLLGLPRLEGYRALAWAYVAGALVVLLLYARLKSGVEPMHPPTSGKRRASLHKSRGIVVRLAALFAVDSFAGAFVVQGLIAYWFAQRFGVEPAFLGAIFFGTNLFSGLSFFAAAPIARRIGLLETMVFTHLPSNVLLMLVPLMPNVELAVAVLLARNLLSQLDVPTRQSYTMAVVAPDERSAAAGFTSVARNIAAAVAPALAGATYAVPALGLPFFIAGGLKIAYDLAIYATFRGLRPPEETRSRASS